MSESVLLPWLAGLFAFILGSVPFGVLVARLFKVRDLTHQGSGNIGATNVSRVVGFWPAGAITFALDVLKGALPILVCFPAGVQVWGAWLGHGAYAFSETALWGFGLAAVAGHCFSPWVKFRGGKGVATGFGALLVLSPWAALLGILAFGLVFLIRRTGSLGSLTGLSVAAISHLVINGSSGTHLVFGALLVAVIVFRHESNIDALLLGQERKF